MWKCLYVVERIEKLIIRINVNSCYKNYLFLLKLFKLKLLCFMKLVILIFNFIDLLLICRLFFEFCFFFCIWGLI